MKALLPLILFLLVCTMEVVSQPASEKDSQLPDPKIAFLKSMAMPGWGHYYVDNSNWIRGQYHLAAEAALVLSFFGFTIHSKNLQQNWYAYGQAEAGVPIKDRSRQFQLAVGDFNNLEAYNDYQLRSRNWDQLFADTPENRWSWGSEAERSQYNDLRSRFETLDQQLPALLGLMVVNRIISGISAYNRARKKQQSHSMTTSLHLSPYQFSSGIVANMKIQF